MRIQENGTVKNLLTVCLGYYSIYIQGDYKKAIELGRKARQNGGIRMLVDKNGKEITAGCKIVVGETVFNVWGVDPEVRQEVKDFLATKALVVDNREYPLQLPFSNRTPMEPTPLKEWLKEDV